MQDIDRARGIRIPMVVLGFMCLAGCALTEEARLEKQTKMAEKRELWAYMQRSCEESVDGAWMCAGGTESQHEDFPWLHCDCVDSRNTLR